MTVTATVTQITGPEVLANDATAFDALDDAVQSVTARGVVMVQVAGPSDVHGIAGHAVRRIAATGRRVVRGAGHGVESAFRDVAQRLGIHPVPHNAREAAQHIVAALSDGATAAVVPVLRVTAWDELVVRALIESPIDGLLVVIAPAGLELDGVAEADRFKVDARLSESGSSRWWEALAQQLHRDHPSDQVGDLEAWRSAAMTAKPQPPPVASDLSGASQRLLARLTLVDRSWPEASISALLSDISAPLTDSDAPLQELADAGLADRAHGLVVVCPAAAASPSGVVIAAADRDQAADALTTVFDSDAWAWGRAAELLSGSPERAEQSMRRALSLAQETSSRVELWRRWNAVIETFDMAATLDARVRGAELALELGDVDVAMAWAERASGVSPRPEAALVLGRAALGRGDLVSASAALERAHELATDDALKYRAQVELAEVRYASGDLDGARQLAQRVADALVSAECADHARVRLGARNLLGKLLLSQGTWDAADAHFAADACEAAFCGEFMCELRARVNRAIALLSRGSPDEARPILIEVLRNAEERGEPRAVGFALSNLVVLAIARRDYGEGLRFAERAIEVRRRLGDRLGFARDVTNLVTLRVRLGLLPQAEQALRFGRSALGPGAPPTHLAELALSAARVHLACGRTLEADREARNGVQIGAKVPGGDWENEGHRIAVRIALEDGLVERAAAELEKACESPSSVFAAGEVAVLRAAVGRAMGEVTLDDVRDAVMAARESGDEELAREAHVVAAQVSLAQGELDRARDHVRAACSLRDEVARSLDRSLAESYLARAEMQRLARLQESVELSDEEPVSQPASPRPRRAGRAKRREVRFVGVHPTVKRLLASMEKVGPTDATVLVHGESGSGKELVAEAIHRASPRADGPLVKVNCAALVETLLLSELFGHEKGAFTGANQRKRGRFERANGGTLFLDEIGDISPRTQVALLRVLEEGVIERVGGTAPISVDVRIVCATHRDLKEMVARGEFREDLYYRLSGMTLQVPALRQRIADLPLVAETLLARIADDRDEAPKRLGAAAVDLLKRHTWPGNVRELQNALSAASLFAEGEEIQPADVYENVASLAKVHDEAPGSVRAPSVPPTAMPEWREEPVGGAAYRNIRDDGVSLSDLKRQIERECIAQALTETDGNITRAAAVLGMKRPRLSQLVKQYGLLDSTGNGGAVGSSRSAQESE